MCANYKPVTQMDRLVAIFGVTRKGQASPELRESPEPGSDASPDIWPLGTAPFIRRAQDGSGNRVVDDGVFGLLPRFAKELAFGRHTYNARSETVATLPSFRDAWRSVWRCVIPAQAIHELNWETGRPVRWTLQQADAVPMGIAGIYHAWHAPDGSDGQELFTFSMLTVNADGHPVMQRFHKPGDEKRMVVILDPADYDLWLSCPVREASAFLRQGRGTLEATPEPLPPRAPKHSSVRTARPVPVPAPASAHLPAAQGALF